MAQPEQVADDDDRDGLPQAELENDAERAERPVDRRDVGAGPDPHLLRPGRVPVGIGDGFYAVNVGTQLGIRHDALRTKDCSRRGRSKIVPAVPFSAQAVFGPVVSAPVASGPAIGPGRAEGPGAHARAQQANQQGHTIRVSRARRRSIGWMPESCRSRLRAKCPRSAGLLRGRGPIPRGRSAPAFPQAVADRKLDARCGALICRHEAVADLALRGRPAALIAADAQDPARQALEVALDACGAAEIRGDRAEVLRGSCRSTRSGVGTPVSDAPGRQAAAFATSPNMSNTLSGG